MNPARETIHRAGWAVVDPETILRDGWVRVSDGVIAEVGGGRPPGGIDRVDHGPGALMPALVNAHTHLELSALGGIPRGDGFRQWVFALIRARETAGTAALRQGAAAAAATLAGSGCSVIGEVSTLGITADLTENAGLSGVWFRERLGNPGPAPPPAQADLPSPAGDGRKMIRSLAGHGPHTTAPALLRALKSAARRAGTPFSIHLAESEEEETFLTTGRGPWADLLAERGIDHSGWGLPATSPVDHVRRLGLLDGATLAVHLIRTRKGDLPALAGAGAKVCLCPRSNRNLHDRLPDLTGMLTAGLRPCLGTDSLASADSLDLADEMALLAQAFPGVPPAAILAMATRNGAEALGLGASWGTLSPGKRGRFAYAPVRGGTPGAVMEAIINDIPPAGKRKEFRTIP